MLGNPDYQFYDLAAGGPVGCGGRQIYINTNHRYWAEAYTAQVRNLAQAAVEQCANRGAEERE
jgi:hypothetical protein